MGPPERLFSGLAGKIINSASNSHFRRTSVGHVLRGVFADHAEILPLCLPKPILDFIDSVVRKHSSIRYLCFFLFLFRTGN